MLVCLALVAMVVSTSKVLGAQTTEPTGQLRLMRLATYPYKAQGQVAAGVPTTPLVEQAVHPYLGQAAVVVGVAFHQSHRKTAAWVGRPEMLPVALLVCLLALLMVAQDLLASALDPALGLVAALLTLLLQALAATVAFPVVAAVGVAAL